MALYLFLAGKPGWNTLFGRKLMAIYAFGAVIALWFGREPIGTLQPVTLRPIFIALGVILMLAMFILMLTTRDTAKQLERRANERYEVRKFYRVGIRFNPPSMNSRTISFE